MIWLSREEGVMSELRVRHGTPSMTMDALADWLTGFVAQTPQRMCSEGYLFTRAREQLPLTIGPTELRAALAVAMTRGQLTTDRNGLASTDKTPWVRLGPAGPDPL